MRGTIRKVAAGAGAALHTRRRDEVCFILSKPGGRPRDGLFRFGITTGSGVCRNRIKPRGPRQDGRWWRPVTRLQVPRVLLRPTMHSRSVAPGMVAGMQSPTGRRSTGSTRANQGIEYATMAAAVAEGSSSLLQACPPNQHGLPIHHGHHPSRKQNVNFCICRHQILSETLRVESVHPFGMSSASVLIAQLLVSAGLAAGSSLNAVVLWAIH